MCSGSSRLIVVSTSVFFGLAPALHATRVDLTSAVKQMGAGGGTPGARRVRSALVVAQLALSVVLLVGAGLMVRSMINLANVDLGFRSEDVLTFRLALPRTRYAEPPRRVEFYQRLMRELGARPEVRAAAATGGLPYGDNWSRAFLAEGDTRTRLSELTSVRYVPVTPDYFRAMGIPVSSGRAFTDSDGLANPAIIVSDNVAAHFWPGQDALGRRVKIDSFQPGEEWRTVVGIVGDVRSSSPRDQPPLTVYVPHATEPMSAMTVVLRARAGMPPLIADARAVVRRLDPELPLAAVRPLKVVVARASWTFRLYTQLFVLFASIAILLAAVGLAGIMAHLVAERTREIGVRMALGAAPGDVLAMVLRSAATLAAGGIALGVVAALMLTRGLSSLLFGVTPADADDARVGIGAARRGGTRCQLAARAHCRARQPHGRLAHRVSLLRARPRPPHGGRTLVAGRWSAATVVATAVRPDSTRRRHWSVPLSLASHPRLLLKRPFGGVHWSGPASFASHTQPVPTFLYRPLGGVHWFGPVSFGSHTQRWPSFL